MEPRQKRVRLARTAVIASVAVLGTLALAPAASAQSAAADQYLPQASPSSANSGAGAPNAGAQATDPGDGQGGALPFTGYPLTPIVAVVGLLLGGGLALRTVAPRLDRRRA